MTNDYGCSRATAVWRRGGENVYFREFLNFVVYKNTCKICFRAPLSAVIASIDAPMHPLQRCTRPTAIRGISIFSTFWGRALSALRSPSYIYIYMRLWEQKSVIGLNKRNARKGASKFCTIIRTEIDNFVFPIYTLTLRYFSNTFHHDSAPARPRSREIRALLLNVRRRPIARWKAYLNSYALSTKRAIWLVEPDISFLISEPHIDYILI